MKDKNGGKGGGGRGGGQGGGGKGGGGRGGGGGRAGGGAAGAAGGKIGKSNKRWRGGAAAAAAAGDGGGSSDGAPPPKQRKGKAAVRNALRKAQLDKSELLLWRKFGYGRQLFLQYYRKQGITRDSELARLEATYAVPLPITFRLHATDARAAPLAARLTELAARRPHPPVKPIAWMPKGQGWQAISKASAATAAADAADAAANADDEFNADDDFSSHTIVREKLHPDVLEVVRAGTSAGLLARQEVRRCVLNR
jgi:hypothetical protein